MFKLTKTFSAITIIVSLTACGGGSGNSNPNGDTNTGGANSSSENSSNGNTSAGVSSDNTNSTSIRIKTSIIRTGKATYTYNYDYDSNNRIKKFVLEIGPTSESQTYEYTYDDNNDLIELAPSGHEGTHYEHENHQLIKTYTRYPNGNIANTNEATEWDKDYLPTLIKSTSYKLDGSVKSSRVKHNTFTNKELTHSEEVLTVNLNSGGIATTRTIADYTYDMNHVNHLLFLSGSSLLDYRPADAAPFTHHLLKTRKTITDRDGTQMVEITYNNTYNSLGNLEIQHLVTTQGNLILSEETIAHEYEEAK